MSTIKVEDVPGAVNGSVTRSLIVSIRNQFSGIVKRNWIRIALFILVTTILGVAYSLLMKPKYTAVCTFVLEDAGHGGLLSQYTGLASLAGLDLGSTGGGMFKGENIFDLYKSRSMLARTLLSPIDVNGRHIKLIDWYIEIHHLNKKWKEDDGIEAVILMAVLKNSPSNKTV